MAIIHFPSYTGFPGFLTEMEGVRNEMDRALSGFRGRTHLKADSGVFPALNVIEESDRILVNMELPGVKPEDIDISVEGNTLNLRGERKRDELENVTYHRRERPEGRFHKALTLPVEINHEAVEAKFELGVLKLVLPKAEDAKPRKIPVRT